MSSYQKPIFLTLHDPCGNDWDKMTACDTGRFCSSCAKNVIDFTDKGPAFIYKTITEGKGQVCGRFDDTQLNRYYYPEPVTASFFRARPLLLAFALGCLVAALQTGSANTVRRQPHVLGDRPLIENPLKPIPAPELAEKQRSVTWITSAGNVYDGNRSEPMSYGMIKVEGVGYVYINRHGYYEIEVPLSMAGQTIDLQFTAFNYWPVKRHIIPGQPIKDVIMHRKPFFLRKRVRLTGCVGF